MGKKRGNGEGSFRKRSMNSWEGRVMIEGEDQEYITKKATEIAKLIEEKLL